MSSSCATCGLKIAGQGLEALGRRYHPECFVCSKCRCKIEGSFLERSGAPWHKKCAEEDRKPELCHTCNKPLQGKVVRALGNAYHVECLSCTKCHSPIDGPFVTNSNKPYHKHCAPVAGPPPPGGAAVGPSKGPCKGSCGKDVFVGEAAVRLADQSLYHTKCFVCEGCRKGFPQGEKYVEHHGKNYHAACSPKAAVCHECKKLIEEDHVLLGTQHYHSTCCKCSVCGKAADSSMVVLGGKAFHIGCSHAAVGDD